MSIGSRISKEDEEKLHESIKAQEKQSAAAKEKKKVKEKELVFVPETPKYTLDDIIVPTYVKDKILDVANYAANSKTVFEDWGLNKTHKYSKRMGINLYGPPGTGKTMAAHAVASYLKRQILIVDYADIESKYVGETSKNIRKAFNAAKDSHSIIFFDEADAILSRRVTDMSRATDVSVNQTRSELLMILNDYQDFIIFATNFIENFDPAFMRRIAMHIEMPLPDYECRRKLWQHYIPDEMPNDIDTTELAGKYAGISGSDISTAILNSAFKAARNHADMVSKEYVYEAIEGIIASKRANEKNQPQVTRRIVSEDYVKQQLGKDVKGVN